jgi:superfamily II DNA or RNA helicase
LRIDVPVDLWGEDIEPRKWQAEALPLVQAELRRGGGPLVWACTGAGKSILQRALIAWVMQSEKPGVIVVDVPTRSLVRQLAATLEQHPWLKGRVGTYYGDRKKLIEQGVIVCCRPSLERLASEIVIRGWKVRLYMVDEAHLSPDEQAAFIARLVDAELGPARRIGVTATPYRSDIKDSLTLWDRIVVEYGLNDAIRDGVLVNLAPRTWDGPGGMEIDEVCVQMLAAHRHHGPMLVNALDIPDAETFASRLRDAGLPAQSIHSGHSMEKRKLLEESLRDGDLACLVHVATLVEGVDWPWLRVLCLRRQAILRARAMMDTEDGKPASKGGSRVRLVQEIGRALRTYPGKTEAYILDPVGVCDLVGLVHGENIGGDRKQAAGVGEPTGPREVKPRDLVFVYSTNQILAWLSQAHQFGELAGHIERSRGRGWRSRAPSPRQMEALQKEAERPRIYLPRAIAHMARAGAETLLSIPDAATQGAVSDILGLIYAGRTAYFDEKDRIGRWPSGDDWWRGAIPPLPDNITIKD